MASLPRPGVTTEAIRSHHDDFSADTSTPAAAGETTAVVALSFLASPATAAPPATAGTPAPATSLRSDNPFLAHENIPGRLTSGSTTGESPPREFPPPSPRRPIPAPVTLPPADDSPSESIPASTSAGLPKNGNDGSDGNRVKNDFFFVVAAASTEGVSDPTGGRTAGFATLTGLAALSGFAPLPAFATLPGFAALPAFAAPPGFATLSGFTPLPGFATLSGFAAPAREAGAGAGAGVLSALQKASFLGVAESRLIHPGLACSTGGASAGLGAAAATSAQRTRPAVAPRNRQEGAGGRFMAATKRTGYEFRRDQPE